MNHNILFRSDFTNEDELAIAKKYFQINSNRTKCPPHSTVIGRYSVLPYYKELEDDLKFMSSVLINSYRQHSWIANFEYYEVLQEHTFKTWRQHELANNDYDGPYVVKGCTNSKKHKWNKLMFAANKRQAVEIGIELSQDGLIGQQELLYRKYEPLVEFEVGIDGLPFSNEWRLFFLNDKLLSYGFYWSHASDAEEINLKGCPDEALELAQKVSSLASEYVNFYVIDVAQKLDGSWVLVEMNDGQMSGLSLNDPDELYSNLKKTIGDL